MGTRFAEHLLTGIHAGRPAAGDVPEGTLYACSTHGLIYQSDTSTWSTWATFSGVSDILDLATAETDVSLVLAPDGAGGVEFRAESGGGASGLPIDAAAAAAVGSGDLFTGTSLDGGWSSLQATALDVVSRSIDGYLVLGNTAATGTDVFRGLQRAFSPSGDFTVYAKVMYSRLHANYRAFGLFAGATDPSDAGGGAKIIAFVYYSSGVFQLQLSKWSAASKSLVFDASATALYAFPNADSHQFPIWLAVRRVGSNLSLGLSTDGVEWVWHGTTTTISFTVNTCGVAIMGQGIGDVRAIYDYIATIG